MTEVRRFDYLPFGELIASFHRPAGYGVLPPRQQFTGKERDAESGWDYFGARYLGVTGRFTSPDAPLVDQSPADAKSWNLYSYARNNPLLLVDPTGMCIELPENKGYDDSDDTTKGKRLFEGPCAKQSIGGELSHQVEVSEEPTAAVWEALRGFRGRGPKRIEYSEDDPFTKSFQPSIGMEAIREAVRRDCRSGRVAQGKFAVSTPEAFVNAIIEDLTRSAGFFNPHAQLGAFSGSYYRYDGVLEVRVENRINLSSAALHIPNRIGVKNIVGPRPLGEVL